MINNNTKFIIKLDKKEIEVTKTIITPTEVSEKTHKPISYQKKQQTREAIFFRFLGFIKNDEDIDKDIDINIDDGNKHISKHIILIDDIFECLAFIEIIKGYNYNKLNKDIDYSFNSFKVKAVKKNNINRLRIIFHKKNYTIHITKVDCVILVAQLNKIIHKCEVDSRNNQFILNCPSDIGQINGKK